MRGLKKEIKCEAKTEGLTAVKKKDQDAAALIQTVTAENTLSHSNLVC